MHNGTKTLSITNGCVCVSVCVLRGWGLRGGREESVCPECSGGCQDPKWAAGGEGQGVGGVCHTGAKIRIGLVWT